MLTKPAAIKRLKGLAWIYIGFMVGIIPPIIFVIIHFQHDGRLTYNGIFTVLALAVSTSCIGAMVGFVFGVGVKKNDNSSQQNKDVSVNDSLVQIRDWLTKTIVIALLLEAHRIPNFSSEIIQLAGPSISKSSIGGLIVFSILLYYGLIGLCAGFVVTHRFFKKFSENQNINIMIEYSDYRALGSIIYQQFLQQLQIRNVYAFSGSGSEVQPFLEQGVLDAITQNEIPERFSFYTTEAEIYPLTIALVNDKLQQIQGNTLVLANQMADDAGAENSNELHEWSLSVAKRKLCPLWPFLKRPCSQYV